jgi:flagellar protein FliL
MSVTKMPVAEAEATAEAPKKSKKKSIIAVGLVFVLAGAAYWFVLKPPAEEPAPEPGAVVVLEPIQINLAGGHYLSLGLALQATADAHEEPDGSKALDSAIELFSGQAMEDLASPKDRHQLKKDLLHEVEERYEHEVMDVYFTEFVTQ